MYNRDQSALREENYINKSTKTRIETGIKSQHLEGEIPKQTKNKNARLAFKSRVGTSTGLHTDFLFR